MLFPKGKCYLKSREKKKKIRIGLSFGRVEYVEQIFVVDERAFWFVGLDGFVFLVFILGSLRC